MSGLVKILTPVSALLLALVVIGIIVLTALKIAVPTELYAFAIALMTGHFALSVPATGSATTSTGTRPTSSQVAAAQGATTQSHI
ncbi:MAG: hypothetical protein ACYDDZ_10995 [Acidimicrobiales bacterium]